MPSQGRRSRRRRQSCGLACLTCCDALGATFDGGLTAREIAYLVRHEWARSPDDILWRRSKLGLRTGRDVVAYGTTDIVANPRQYLDPERPALLVSFARCRAPRCCCSWPG